MLYAIPSDIHYGNNYVNCARKKPEKSKDDPCIRPTGRSLFPSFLVDGVNWKRHQSTKIQTTNEQNPVQNIILHSLLFKNAINR